MTVNLDQIGSGVDRDFEAIRDLQSHVIDTQRELIIRVATVMADTISRDGRILVVSL